LRQETRLQQSRPTPAEPSPIPRRTLRLGHDNIILPIPNHLSVLSPQDRAGLWFPSEPFLIASRALGVGSRDGVAAFVNGGRASAFGELSGLEDVVVVGLGLPAVADVVVGCALGFGDCDDVVVFGCCCGLGELAFFCGDVGSCDFSLVGLLVFFLWMNGGDMAFACRPRWL
jgi:hypothetical protein